LKKAPNQTLKPIPIIVARAKFMERITEEVNRSGLPAFVMRDVIKDLLQALEQLSEQQCREELRRYNAATGETVGASMEQAASPQHEAEEASDERKEE